eukprot:TRINITY_DN3910_c0_g1_i7.p1 TRINITY_DN3910_c0_g1~~TRINITY_DN3910_c0_g1_i7.p1  ORF type:complete len:1075 (+),score=202.64 TRINITY_DN3910_c0_g1_i7:1363-4587(+)
MAELSYRFSQNDANDIIFSHFVGCTGESIYLHMLLARAMRLYQAHAGIEKDISEDPETIVNSFTPFLKSLPTLPRGQSRIMILDAINQLTEDATQPSSLRWLPASLPMSVHMIISTTSDSEALASARALGWNEIELLPLDVPDRMLIIQDYFSMYSKRLTKEQTDILANASSTSNPLFLRAAMDELRMYGDYYKLTDKIHTILKASSVIDLYRQILERWSADFGADLVRKTLGAIYVSQNGFTQNELIAFVNLPRVTFLSFFAVLKNSLFSRKGRYDFFHQQLRIATKSTYFENPANLTEMHDAVSSWMITYYQFDFHASSVSKVEPVVHVEMAYQLQEAGRYEELASLLGIIQVFESFSTGRRKFELLTYWRDLIFRGVDIASVYDSCLGRMGDVIKWNFDVAGRIGDLYLALDIYDAADKVLEDILAAKTQVYGEKHELIPRTLDQLARLRYAQGRYDDSEHLYRRSISIREDILGHEHLDVASTLNNLGLLHVEQGEFEEALKSYNRALKITEKCLGKYHVDVGTILNNLATLYKAQGKYDLALQCCERDLAISEMKLGREHIDVAIALNNLGSIYEAQGKYKDAEALYVRSLGIKEKVVGKESPDVAATLDNMGQLYSAQEKFEEAKKCYHRALDIRKRKLGEKHPDVARTLGNLGNLLKAQGLYKEALAMHQDCHLVLEKVHEKDHPDIATALNNLAAVYHAMGEKATAIDMYRKCLSMRERVLGPTHPDVAAALTNLGTIYYESGEYTIAKPFFTQGLEIRERSLGCSHPLTLLTREWLDDWPEDDEESPPEVLTPMKKVQIMGATTTAFKMSGDHSTGTTREVANKQLNDLLDKALRSTDNDSSDFVSPRAALKQNQTTPRSSHEQDKLRVSTKQSVVAEALPSNNSSGELPMAVVVEPVPLLASPRKDKRNSNGPDFERGNKRPSSSQSSRSSGSRPWSGKGDRTSVIQGSKIDTKKEVGTKLLPGDALVPQKVQRNADDPYSNDSDFTSQISADSLPNVPLPVEGSAADEDYPIEAMPESGDATERDAWAKGALRTHLAVVSPSQTEEEAIDFETNSLGSSFIEL